MSKTRSNDSSLSKPRRIALAGNPNTGKTTLFNLLTGLNHKVGNYAGVTVEKKSGWFQAGALQIEVIDLPGTYSLASRSPDEIVVTDMLIGKQAGEEPPELIVVIVDAGNIQRNFYLFSQLLELNIPVIVALNMTDLAEGKGIHIQHEGISETLGIPVVPIIASRNVGVDQLITKIENALSNPSNQLKSKPEFPTKLNDAVSNLKIWINKNSTPEQDGITTTEVFRALMDEGGIAEKRIASRYGNNLLDKIVDSRKEISGNLPISAIEAKARYEWINHLLNGNVIRPETHQQTLSDKLDRVLTHKVFGLAFFIFVMGLIFQSIYSWSGPVMEAIEGVFAAVGNLAASIIPEGALQSLVVDGIIAGVGGVLVFLPQIVILFIFIAILEDCGYMPRAAFLMDRVLSRFGLSGKSFIPLLSSFACAVPGIMAARTIENRKDRIATILIAPLMSCSARLPVYIIFIGAFVPDRTLLGSWINVQGVTLFGMYLIGIIAAVPVAWIVTTFFFKGETSPFIMELPR